MGTWICQLEKLFVEAPSWLSSYRVSRLLFASAPIVFGSYSSLAVLTELRSLLFCIAVAEHSVYASMLLFLSLFLDGPSDATYDFDGVTSPVESGVLLLLMSGVHSFVSDVRLLSVFLVFSLTTGRHIRAIIGALRSIGMLKRVSGASRLRPGLVICYTFRPVW